MPGMIVMSRENVFLEERARGRMLWPCSSELTRYYMSSSSRPSLPSSLVTDSIEDEQIVISNCSCSSNCELVSPTTVTIHRRDVQQARPPVEMEYIH